MRDRVPNFFLIGSPKSGTTTLYEALSQHPDVYMASPKEPAYFSNDREYALGLDYYCRTYYRDLGAQSVVGEATPWYLHVPAVPERIRADLPDESHRFVAILRSPVTRAISQYWDQVNVGRERRAILDAFEADRERAEWPASQRECAQSYLRCSRYEAHLSRFLDLFGRGRILVLIQEDLRQPASRKASFEKLAAFLGVDPVPLADFDGRANVAKAARFKALERIASAPDGKRSRLRDRLANSSVIRPQARRLMARLSTLNQIEASNPAPPPELQAWIGDYFESTVDYVEVVAGRSLDDWRVGPAGC